MISWQYSEGEKDWLAFGYVHGEMKYFVGYWSHTKSMIADVKNKEDSWEDMNVPIRTLEEGIQICEMWEATGAY